MVHFVKSTMNPGSYHGTDKKPPYFEGWYVKLVSKDLSHRFAIIPGISLSDNPSKPSHSFIQVLNGISGESIYIPFPEKAFISEPYQYNIHVAGNHFHAAGIHLEIDHPELAIHGDLSFSGGVPWPVNLFSPGIMGWYAWVPGMECYHGVLSFNHHIHGSLSINGETIDFTGGLGYMEKDWGKAFPQAWIWYQSNHFQHPNLCITASMAIIPWGKLAFPGFIVGLWHEGRLFRFATYTGAKVRDLSISDDQVHWILEGSNHRLEMNARRTSGGILLAPTIAGMDRRIAETLTATIEIKLSHRKGSNWIGILEDVGSCAGLEAVGDLDRLINMIPR